VVRSLCGWGAKGQPTAAGTLELFTVDPLPTVYTHCEKSSASPHGLRPTGRPIADSVLVVDDLLFGLFRVLKLLSRLFEVRLSDLRTAVADSEHPGLGRQ